MEEGEAGPSNSLDEDNEIARFVSVTNCPPEQVQFVLDAAGSFNGAVSLYYGMFGAPRTA